MKATQKVNPGPVDLRTCKPGDKLLSCHGMILTYGKYIGETNVYPHEVIYPNGSRGTRLDDGRAYRYKPLPSDHNIVEILGQ